MPYCVVKRCKNTSVNLKKNTGLSFHRFPMEPNLRNQWMNILRKNREDDSWNPSRFSVICSAHFQEKDLYTTKTGLRRLRKDAVPTLSLFSTTDIPTVIASLEPVHDSPSIVFPSSIKTPIHLSQCRSSSTTVLPGTSAENISPNLLVASSDTDSIFDTPRRIKLKSELRKHQLLRITTKKKIKSLQQKVRRLKKKNSSLTSILNDLKRKNLINVDIHKNLTDNVVCTELFHSIYIRCKGKKKLKFTPAIKKFCLTLDFYSPKAYEYVRKSFNTCLPHRKTLAKWYTHVNGAPGFTEESFSALRETVAHNTHQPLCALMFDEMAIRQQKIWNGKKYIGVVDMGDEITNSTHLASQAFVFMLVGINFNFKIPLGYFLTNNLTGEQKANLVKSCLIKCHEVGVKVLSLTFDGHTTNLSAMELLGCKISDAKTLKTTFKHPSENRQVACFLDPSHVIKMVRNQLEAKKYFIDEEGSSVSWEYFIKLDKLQESEGLHLANKITKKHILFRTQIMKVKLATQLLSRSVATALKLCREDLKLLDFQQSAPTQKFVELINNMFDIFNTRAMAHRGFKKPIYTGNKNEIYALLDQVEHYISNLQIKTFTKRSVRINDTQRHLITTLNKRVTETRSKTGFLGILININSLKFLYEYVVETEKSLAFIPMYKLSQDHLEIFFGSIRMHGGHNDNPNAKQFKGIYRKLLTHLELKCLDTGNCVPLETVSILACTSSTQIINYTSSSYRHEEIEPSPELDFLSVVSNDASDLARKLDLPDFNDMRRLIVGYISGSVVHYLTKTIKCDYCLTRLASTDRHDFHKLINLRNKGGLCYPSPETFEICLVAETVIRKIIKENFVIITENQYRYITSQILKRFINNDKIFKNLEIDHNCYGHEHKIHLLKCVIEKYLSIRLHHLSKLEAISRGAVTKRQYYRKLTQNQGL